jgi:hypothetical protein
MNRLMHTALVAAGAAALFAGAPSFSASAAPLGQNVDGLKAAASSNTIEVQRRHRHRGAAIALGAFGVGVVAGAALSNRGYYYYDQPYGYYEQPYGYYYQPYGYSYYGNPYYEDPVYTGNY